MTTNIPVALQLFVLRGECEKDLDATLKAVAGMGYEAVEPWGYAGDKVEWMGRILRKFPGRARSVHLRDYGGAPGTVIGEGEADWDEIFRLCETSGGTEWYVVEEGGKDGIGFDVPRRSLKALREMGK